MPKRTDQAFGYGTGKAHPVDEQVGRQLRHRRVLLGLSMEQLAERIGVRYQQVQKYETGTNRLSAGRLFALSKILDVPIEYFFDGLPNVSLNATGDGTIQFKRESLELVRAYYKIGNSDARRRLFHLIRAVAGEND